MNPVELLIYAAAHELLRRPPPFVRRGLYYVALEVLDLGDFIER